MHSFHINALSAAIILSTLIMGLIGLFVLIPVACIQWTWNFVAAYIFVVPIINAWQAVLLYLAGATLLYIFGLVQIEVKSESFDESSVPTPLREHLRQLQERLRAKHKPEKKLSDRENDETKRRD